MDNKTIGINALITLGIVTLAMLTPAFFEGDKYFCESRPELGLVQCDSFSKYVAENGKCIDNDGPNLICKTGWVLVEDDREFEIPAVVTIQATEYVCDQKECLRTK